jgi:hypothetical protein
LTAKRGRQDWRFYSAQANKSILGIHNPRIDRAPDVDDDDGESFVGTNDGFED